jgi:8-oxo-dGTP diphosphatase
VSVIYYAISNATEHKVKGDDDAADAQWFDIKKLPVIAFDHYSILQQVIEELKLG